MVVEAVVDILDGRRDHTVGSLFSSASALHRNPDRRRHPRDADHRRRVHPDHHPRADRADVPRGRRSRGRDRADGRDGRAAAQPRAGRRQRMAGLRGDHRAVPADRGRRKHLQRDRRGDQRLVRGLRDRGPHRAGSAVAAERHRGHRPVRGAAPGEGPAALRGHDGRARRRSPRRRRRRPGSSLRILAVVHHRNAAVGVFADAAAGHELVEWLPHEAAPPDPGAFDAAMVFGAEAQVDQEDAHPWLRPEKRVRARAARARHPAARHLLRLAAARREPPAPRCAAAAEPGDRLVSGRADRGRARRPAARLPAASASRRLQWHHYEWLLPPGAVALAHSSLCLQAFRLRDRPAWGVQFHPEVTRAGLRRVARRMGRRRRRGQRDRPEPDPRRDGAADRRLERRRPRDRRAVPRATAG